MSLAIKEFLTRYQSEDQGVSNNEVAPVTDSDVSPEPSETTDRYGQLATFTNTVEASGKQGLGFHDRSRSTAFGDYGITEYAYKDIAQANPLFKEKKLEALSSTEQKQAFDTYMDVLGKQLKAKGVEVNDSNLARAWFLGSEGLRERLSSGNYLDSTLKANAPKGTDISTPEGRAKAIAAVTEIDESRRLGITVPEYRQALKENKQLESKFTSKVERTIASKEKQTEDSQPAFEFIDGDTIKFKGEKETFSLRMDGINTREIPGFDLEKGKFKTGEFGGLTDKQVAEEIAKRFKFDTPVFDPDKKDVSGKRIISDITNAKGESFVSTMLKYQLASPTTFSSRSQLIENTMGRIEMAGRAATDPVNKLDRLRSGDANAFSDSTDYITYLLREQRSQLPVQAKPFATEARLFGASPDFYAGVSYVRPEEDVMGMAKSNWVTSWNSATNNMARSFASTYDMGAYVLGNSQARENFKITKEYYDNIEKELPFLKDANALNPETGEWSLDTFEKFGNWFAATAAGSAPDLLMGLAASVLTVPTLGLSHVPGVLRYAGEVWNDQAEDKKSPGSALVGGVAMQAFEALGAGKLLKTLTLKEMTEEGISNLVAKGYTREAAEKAFIKEAKQLHKQILDIGAVTLKGGVEESITEGLQELTGYFAKQGFEMNVNDPNQLKNQMLNAMFGGFVLGGGFAGSGRGFNRLTYSYETSPAPSDIKFREDNFHKEGIDVPFVIDVQDQAIEMVGDDTQANNQLSGIEESKRRTSGLTATVKNWWTDKGWRALLPGYSKMIAGKDPNKGVFTAAFNTLLGANNAINGGDIYSNKAIVSGAIAKTIGSLKDVFTTFSNLKPEQVSEIMYRSDVRSYVDKLLLQATNAKNKLGKQETDPVARMDYAFKNVDPKGLLDPSVITHARAIALFATKLNQMVQTSNSYTNETKTLSDFLANKSLNKDFINSSRKQFIKDLMASGSNINYNDAIKFVDRIMNGDFTNEIDPEGDFGFDLGFSPKTILDAIKTDRSGLMKKYFHNNLFENIDSVINAGGNKYVSINLVGKDGARGYALLRAAVKAGELNTDEAAFKAKEWADFLKIRDKEYHTIDNPFINGAMNLITFLGTVSTLPLAAISSTTEFGLVMRGLSAKQTAKAYKRLLSSLATDLLSVVKEIGTTYPYSGSAHRVELSNYGFETGEGAVAERYDIQSGVYQKLTNSFFKMVGLQSVTNATRSARLAVANDAIKSWHETVRNPLLAGADLNQEQQDAFDHLVRIGIDPYFLVDLEKGKNKTLEGTKEAEAKAEIMFERAMHNFVNEAVVSPNPLNRPKFYSDPYLKLFTLFQGYISTFTATILPKLYGDLGKKGSADQKNALATIATMAAITTFAMMLKDMIKYGETPPKWLKDDEAKMVQRLIGASGLLGTGERVLNFVHPLLENRSKTKLEGLYNIIEGESPVISYAGKLGKAVESVLDENSTNTIKKVTKVAPFVGSVNQLGDYLQKSFGGN